MTRFVPFTLADGSSRVYVNADRVTYIAPLTDEDGDPVNGQSIISLGAGDFVKVLAGAPEAAGMLS